MIGQMLHPQLAIVVEAFRNSTRNRTPSRLRFYQIHFFTCHWFAADLMWI